jgi:hypothetical protein
MKITKELLLQQRDELRARRASLDGAIVHCEQLLAFMEAPEPELPKPEPELQQPEVAKPPAILNGKKNRK